MKLSGKLLGDIVIIEITLFGYIIINFGNLEAIFIQNCIFLVVFDHELSINILSSTRTKNTANSSQYRKKGSKQGNENN